MKSSVFIPPPPIKLLRKALGTNQKSRWKKQDGMLKNKALRAEGSQKVGALKAYNN